MIDVPLLALPNYGLVLKIMFVMLSILVSTESVIFIEQLVEQK